jgi:hypothetical protein
MTVGMSSFDHHSMSPLSPPFYPRHPTVQQKNVYNSPNKIIDLCHMTRFAEWSHD